MAISLSSLKKTGAPANPITIIYGNEKVGKSQLASEWPGAIFLQTVGETPSSDVQADTFGVIDSFEGVMDAIGALYTEEHEFQSLVIDALDGVERLVNVETCRRNGYPTIESPDYGKGWKDSMDVWAEFIDAINALRNDKGINIVLIAHANITKFNSPTSTSYDFYRPNIYLKADERLRANADIITFVDQKVEIKTEKGAFGGEAKHADGAGIRMMYLDERPGFVAGNRYSMPAEIRFRKGNGFAELAKYLPGAPK